MSSPSFSSSLSPISAAVAASPAISSSLKWLVGLMYVCSIVLIGWNLGTHPLNSSLHRQSTSFERLDDIRSVSEQELKYALCHFDADNMTNCAQPQNISLHRKSTAVESLDDIRSVSDDTYLISQTTSDFDKLRMHEERSNVCDPTLNATQATDAKRARRLVSVTLGVEQELKYALCHFDADNMTNCAQPQNISLHRKSTAVESLDDIRSVSDDTYLISQTTSDFDKLRKHSSSSLRLLAPTPTAAATGKPGE